MIPILYEYTETSFASNGLGRLRDCISCVVTEERNGIYECDFEYPVDGAHFNDIYPGRIIAVTHDDSNDVQPFDIMSYEKPIDGIVTFHCVHISYRQSKLVVAGTGINSLADAFTMLGTSQPTNRFSYSADFTSNAYMAAADGVPRSVRSMLGGVEGSILDTYGGEFEWNKFNVILHRNRGVARNFAVRYGVNLIDYNEDVDYSGIYSAAVPYWVGDSNGKQVVVVGNRVQSGLATVTHRGETVALDLSDKFENKPTKTQLQNWAKTHMLGNYTNLPSQNISIDFVRLQDTSEFSALAPLMQCRLCDTIKMYFPRYNVTGSFKIVKTEYDVLQERFVGMELGTLSTTLAEALGVDESSGATFKAGDYVAQDTPYVDLDTSASPGTTDADLYAALQNIGWASDLVADDLLDLKKLFTKQATRNLQVYRFQQSTTTGTNYTVGDSTGGLMIATGAASGLMGLYMWSTNSSGSITAKTISAASNLTISTSTHTYTVTKSGSGTAFVNFIVLYGDGNITQS